MHISHPGRSKTQEIPSVRLWREGLPIQGPALRPGFGPEDIYQNHGCCTGPFEAPGHPCTELSGRLAHSGSLQGASESSQGYRSRPHPFSWPQDERQEECAPPISTNRISRGSFGFRSDAGPFGSCPDTSFYSMFGPLQARPSCLCRYLPQAVGPYGSSLPCVAPRAASHEAIPLVDEGAELHPTVPATRLIRVSRSCCRHLLMWRDPVFLQSGVRMGAIHRRHMITTDASMTGWGAVFEGRPASGEWKEEFLFWHINCLELRAVFLALKYFLPVLGGHHIIVRTDNMAVVSQGINRQGGSKSRTLDRLARHLLLWSQDKFLSLRAVHVPGVLNLAADFLSRQKLEPGEWMLNRQTVSQIWDLFGKAEMDLFASTRVIPVPALVLPKFPDDSGHSCVRPPMADCQSVRVSANKADSGSTMQSEGERCPSPSHSPILALPDLVLGANSPLVSASLGDSNQAGLAVPASGQDLASSARTLEVVGMAHTGPRAVIDDLPDEVQETIASARAPATRKLYSSKWGVFESWCLTRAIDPVNCPVGPVLEFLQERLTAGAAATTLRVYVAAIAARRELDEIPLGRHRMVSAFMRGARRLRPVRPTAVPSWDLSVVLEGLVTAPFEPLESASDRILTLKVVLLLALTSLKRVGDLQAFSDSETCMDFAPGLVKVTLRPRPGYIPKVLSTSVSISGCHAALFPSPLPLLQVRMKDSTCSARSGHWSCMWIASRFGENLPSYWSVLVLVAAGLPRQSRGFLTGWETPFRWLMRRGNSLHLLVFGRILLEA